MAGENEVDGIGGGNELTDEVGVLGVAVDAAVADEDDEVCLCLHLGFVVLIGLDNAGKVDALPVFRNIPVCDVGVAYAHDCDLNAVILLDDVRSIAVPGFPVAACVVIGACIEIVCHGNADLRFGLRGSGGQVVKLALKNIHAVVKLMIAHDPHVVVHHTHYLHGRILCILLIERIVICQRCALNSVARVAQEYVFVLCALLLDICGNPCHGLIMGSGFVCVLRVVSCKLLSMHVGCVEEEYLNLVGVGKCSRHHGHYHAQYEHECQKA